MATSRFALREEWIGHERAVSMVKFSPDGTRCVRTRCERGGKGRRRTSADRLDVDRLASASADRTLCVWDWEKLSKGDGEDATKQPEMVLKGHTMGVSSVAWSTSSRYLCSASDDRTLRLWDTKSEGKCVKVLKGHTHFVFCCAFNAQSNLLASGSFDETVKLWEVKTGKLLKDLPAHSDPITAVDFSSDGKQVVSSSFDGLCRVWDAETGHCIRTIVHAGNPPVSFAKFSPNGKYVLAATLDNSIRLWSVDTGTCLKVYQGHTNERYCLVSAFCTSSKTGKWVISGSEDHGIYIWDLQKKHLAQKIEGRPDKSTPGTGHCSPVLCVDCHPTKSVFASCSHESDKAIKLWEEK